MDIKKEIEELQKGEVFRKWKGKNKDNYLSYALFIFDEDKDKLEVGYYNKKTDKVTTFCILNCGSENRNVKLENEENVFKKPDMKVEELDMGSEIMDVNNILSICSSLQKEKYPAETPVKIILILQKLDPYGQIYNVTYVTKCFKTLNMKIDSETGDIVEDQLVSLVQFPQK